VKERAAFYARVSTARQEQEQTVDSQLVALEKAATALGITVPAERRYVDEGFSGSRLDRPALDALRDAAAEGALDAVLVYCPDRLARNYVHQQVLTEELTKRGVSVRFVEHPVGERAEDRLLVQMQGVIAEYERAKIIERTRRGKQHKVRTGQILPFSMAPYGYAIVRSPDAPKGVLVIDEVEAEHVRDMYRWVAEEGLSVWQVTKRLNERGIRARRRKSWIHSSAYRILTNTIYAGRATYGKREYVEPKRPRNPGGYRKIQKSSARVRPQSQWIEVPTPAIIDEKTRLAVLTALKNNKRCAPRNVQHEYLLRTLVVCGECNWRMTAAHKTTTHGRYEYFYYGCECRNPVMTGRDKRCTARRVQADVLDAIVWSAVVEWIQTPEMLLKEVEAWRVSRSNAQPKERERAHFDGAQRQLTQQIERLIDAYQRGGISIDELKGRRERLEAARDAARAQAEQLAADEMNRSRTERLGDDLKAFAATLRAGLGELDFAGRQRLVRLLIERVVVTGDRVAIEHAIPLSGRFCGLHLHH
jgi:site-specific DNA recombinase